MLRMQLVALSRQVPYLGFENHLCSQGVSVTTLEIYWGEFCLDSPCPDVAPGGVCQTLAGPLQTLGGFHVVKEQSLLQHLGESTVLLSTTGQNYHDCNYKNTPFTIPAIPSPSLQQDSIRMQDRFTESFPLLLHHPCHCCRSSQQLCWVCLFIYLPLSSLFPIL